MFVGWFVVGLVALLGLVYGGELVDIYDREAPAIIDNHKRAYGISQQSRMPL